MPQYFSKMENKDLKIYSRKKFLLRKPNKSVRVMGMKDNTPYKLLKHQRQYMLGRRKELDKTLLRPVFKKRTKDEFMKSRSKKEVGGGFSVKQKYKLKRKKKKGGVVGKKIYSSKKPVKTFTGKLTTYQLLKKDKLPIKQKLQKIMKGVAARNNPLTQKQTFTTDDKPLGGGLYDITHFHKHADHHVGLQFTNSLKPHHLDLLKQAAYKHLGYTTDNHYAEIEDHLHNAIQEGGYHEVHPQAYGDIIRAKHLEV